MSGSKRQGSLSPRHLVQSSPLHIFVCIDPLNEDKAYQRQQDMWPTVTMSSHTM
ncbi:hypothetical protein M404DRAFT_1006287 [Pisolithus tinctorius Marx 270]|uniref:Uncharacterized protein n=1 Tax=Pisolithus tinctorius Marx 270 TaxID=870435 RepID=A0A0C3N7I5_PISTI|nr:hypothetical protein M404DRAFT_1006287 [Pisolithus tinctorius Marx 270]